MTYSVTTSRKHRWEKLAENVLADDALEKVCEAISERTPCKIIRSDGKTLLIWELK